jgi:hypothetical protein
MIPVSVAQFKDWFDRDFPFNTAEDPDALTGIRDKDINKAFAEASALFNPRLFNADIDDNTGLSLLQVGFMYLAAHYLCVDFSNSSAGLNAINKGYMGSKGVGSVSVGYQFPQWIMSSPTYSLIAETGYGKKYLSLIIPQMIGNFGVVKGATQP